MSTRESRFEELEVYRTAQEFRCIAIRIERALPSRKHDLRHTLAVASTGILAEIARVVVEGGSEHGLRGVLTPVRTCRHILQQLRMANLCGRADVTAGIEILERVLELALGRSADC
jgi:hypothetical protein